MTHFIKILLVLYLLLLINIPTNASAVNSHSYPIKDGRINIISVLDDYHINYKYDAVLHKINIEHHSYRANFIDAQNFYYADGSVFRSSSPPIAEQYGFYVDIDTAINILGNILKSNVNISKKNIGSSQLLYIESVVKKETSKEIQRIPHQINESSSGTIDVIIIDAGHGGKDPGAIGIKELYEKDIALEYSKSLAQELKRRMPRKDIKLTRDGDYFIVLQDRPYMANEYIDIGTDKPKNGIFISLHANASVNKNARGFEVFFISADESSEYSRSLAKLENSPSLNVEDKEIEDYVQSLYSYMLIEQYQKESRYMSDLVASEVLKIKGVRKRDPTVKSALFYVLKGALMPAILIEIGFITNKEDVELMTNSKFKDEFSKSVANAVEKFIKDFEDTKAFTQ